MATMRVFTGENLPFILRREKDVLKLWVEYEKVEAPALAEYEKVKASAWAEYMKVKASAWVEYMKVKAPALETFLKRVREIITEEKQVQVVSDKRGGGE